MSFRPSYLAFLLLALAQWVAAGARSASIPAEAWSRDVAAGGYVDGAPVGGFGAGTITWDFQGNFYKGRLDLGSDNFARDPGCGFYMYQKRGTQAAVTRRLDNTLGNGQASYSALFPKAWVEYSGSLFDAKATVTQFSPLIPGDYQRTSYPVAVYRWEISNPTADSMEVALMLTWNNDFGGSSAAALDAAPARGLVLGRGGNPVTGENQGEFALAVEESGGVTVSRASASGLAALVSDFSADGVLSGTLGADTQGAVAFHVTLAPGESISVPMSLSWDLPITELGAGNAWYRRYTRFYDRSGQNAAAIAQEALASAASWESQVDAWHASVLNESKYPGWLKSMLFNELYFYFAGGTVWEAGAASGQLDDPNEDMFSHLETYIYDFYGTSDVRFYGSWPLLLLWPDIDKQAVRQFSDSIYTTRADRPPALGTTAHDFGDRSNLFRQWNAYTYRDSTEWKDLNSKFVLMVYRDWLLTGSSDSALLSYTWQSVQLAMDKVKSQDANGNGLPDSAGIDQTYDDMDLTGDTAYCGGLFLAACQAAREIALVMGDTTRAAQYQSWFDQGSASFDTVLWNGSYYDIDTDSFDPSRIMSDQLCGQWYSQACGLGGIVSQSRALSAMGAVYDNNFLQFDAGAHGVVNVMNAGGTIDTSTPQTQEAWVGTTWGLAAAMVQEGMFSEAEAIGQSLYNTIWNEGQYWFRTPEAWRTGLTNMRAPYYMRATAVWAMKYAYDISPDPCAPFTCTPSPTPTPTPCYASVPVAAVNAGGGAYLDGSAVLWEADQAYAGNSWGYAGGNAATTASAIAGTSDDLLYHDERWGAFSYHFDLPAGSYRVELRLAENYFTYAGGRIMSASAEGVPLVSGLDIFASVGGYTALNASAIVDVSDGSLDILFSASVDSPKVGAIAVYAQEPCPATATPTNTPNWTATPTATVSNTHTVSPTITATPTISTTYTISMTPSTTPTPCGLQLVQRVNCGGNTMPDSSSQWWTSDQAYGPGGWGYTGGTASNTANPIAGTADDALFQSERWGSPLDYRFDLPNGDYQVRMRFCEIYWDNPGERVFSIALEGVTVISNLDLAAAAGRDTAYEEIHTVTVSDGTLNLLGTATVDNPQISAIEIMRVLPPCLTPSQSPSWTVTFSPSPSPSNSPTVSATVSITVTPTATFSPTASPSATGMASLTATPSHSPTVTGTATPSRSSTPSATLTQTPSGSPSVSPSFTAVPTGSTDTPTPTWSPSQTVSPTASETPSASVTVSVTSSPTWSPTWTRSATATPVDSPSATFSPSLSPTSGSTESPTQTVLPTSSSTSSATLTRSPTPTATPTASATQTLTRTRTWTATYSQTRVATPTATGTRTPSPSPSSTPSPAPSAAPSVSATPSSTSQTQEGELRVLQALCAPNPVPNGQARFFVELDGRAERLKVELFSTALTLVGEKETLGSLGSGWHEVVVDVNSLANGTWYARVTAYRDSGASSSPKILRWFLAR